MRTVYHLIQHGMTLEVICENCSNNGVLSHRYLARRFGMAMLLSRLRFRCHRCQARRYRLRFVPKHLGEAAPLRFQSFRGVHEKFQE